MATKIYFRPGIEAFASTSVETLSQILNFCRKHRHDRPTIFKSFGWCSFSGHCRFFPQTRHCSQALRTKAIWRDQLIKINFRRPGRACPKSCNLLSGPAQDLGMCAATDDDRLKRALFRSVLNYCATEPVTWSVASVPCQRSVRTFRDCNDGTEPEPCGLAKSPGSEENSYGSEGSEEKSRVSEENCFHYCRTRDYLWEISGASTGPYGTRRGPDGLPVRHWAAGRRADDVQTYGLTFRHRAPGACSRKS